MLDEVLEEGLPATLEPTLAPFAEPDPGPFDEPDVLAAVDPEPAFDEATIEPGAEVEEPIEADPFASRASVDPLVDEDPFATAVVIDEPVATPQPALRSAPSDDFFLEEPEPPAAAAPAGGTSFPVASSVPASTFVEPDPEFAEPVFADSAPAGGTEDEEFFFESPAPVAPRPAADQSFFIEEPSEPAVASPAPDAGSTVGDWSAVSEPLDLPHEPAAPPPPPPPPRIEVAPIVAAPPPPPVEAPRPARPTGARPAASGPRPGARPAARSAPAASGGGAMRWVLIAAAVLAIGGVGAFFALRGSPPPRIASLDPARARAGERIAIVGEHFGADVQATGVVFGSGVAGKVISASPTRVEVEVPALPVTGDGRVPVVVTSDGMVSPPVELTLFKAPRVHGISPSVAMPGEEVTLAGTDWGPGAIVKFGDLTAAVLDATTTSLRVRVPDVKDPVGTSLPVVVSMGADPSNQAPFVIGRIPLVMSVDPAACRRATS